MVISIKHILNCVLFFVREGHDHSSPGAMFMKLEVRKFFPRKACLDGREAELRGIFILLSLEQFQFPKDAIFFLP